MCSINVFDEDHILCENQKVSLTNQILSKLKKKYITPNDKLYHGFHMQHFTIYRNFIMSLNPRELQMIIMH